MTVPLILLIVLGLAAPFPAFAKWLKITSPHFELYTDAGAETGREALRRLEEIQQVYRGRDGSPVPVRVFLFSSESDFSHYRPAESTTAFFQGGPQRNYIAMRYAGEQTYRVAFHEYVHMVLNHSSARLPRWLEEGTAEFYSTLEMGGASLIAGKPIPAHLRTLRESSWLTAAQLQSVDRDSPYYNERGKVGVFYAQSWALVHMLNVSPKYRSGIQRFASLIDDGTPGPPAFEKAFLRPMETALGDLQAYLKRDRFPVMRIGADPRTNVRISEPRELSPVEAQLAQAELLLTVKNEAEAEKKYKRLARRNPENPEVETGLGALALDRHKYNEARQYLESAIRLGSRDAQTYFEYAMLLRDSGGRPEAVAENLRNALKLNPEFAEAYFMLGLLLTQEDRPGEAVGHLQHAAAILPRQAYIWHALALAHHSLGQDGQARQAAYRAMQAAATRQEAEMAEAALQLTVPAPPRIQPEGKPSENRLDGTLHRIDCLGTAARFYVRSASPRSRLNSSAGRRSRCRCQ